MCGGSLIVVDGDEIAIDVIERGRRNKVTYTNPHVCCPTLACAIVGHVQSVVRSIN
jgi:hypothetical protein